MKNLLLIIATVISFQTVSFASGIGNGEALSIINSEKVILSLESENQKEFIRFSAFDSEKDIVAFVFENNVSMIQVFSEDGEIEMMLPIGSNEVDLGLSLFEKGQYKMGFMVDGMEDVQFTNLSIR